MQTGFGLMGGRRAMAWRAVVSTGVVLALMLLLSNASLAATVDPPAGTWTPVSSPLVSTSDLESVSCISASDCWAVGFSEPKQDTYTLAEHWDGDDWNVVATPDPTDGQLSSIDCVSSADCWSVGVRWSSDTSSVLIEHWDGMDWSIAHSPPVTGMSQLNSVTCISSHDCWAVGYRAVGPDTPETLTQYAMAEQWNGSTWSVFSVPNGTVDNAHPPTGLTGVSCVSAEDCWASGNYDVFLGSSDLITPVFAHWDGTRWTTTTTPGGSEQGAGVTGISCVSSSECWAVGGVADGDGGVGQTLTERWDGTRWSIARSPNVSASSADQLAGVTCTSGSDCWAVGNASGYDSPPGPALTEHWDGSRWSIVPSDQVSTKNDYWLNSVACNGPTDCWSVGSNGSATVTGLVEWLSRPLSISIRPTSGPPGAPITVYGVGFAFDKPVTVTYESDGSSKPADTHLLCYAATTANGEFSCKASIPILDAGLPGLHTVTATSGSAPASTSFGLTG
jgi:hypothetical protein